AKIRMDIVRMVRTMPPQGLSESSLIMLHRWWQSVAQKSRSEDADIDVAPSTVPSGTIGRLARPSRRLWMLLGLGLILAVFVAYAMVALNRETVHLSRPSTLVAAITGDTAVYPLEQAWAVRSAAPRFPEGESGQLVSLPDEWSQTQPGYQGTVWYRFNFDARPLPPAEQVLAVYIERACSNVEVHFNGHLLYRGGRMSEPYARNCYRSHVVTLPMHLLRTEGNQLDMKVGGYPINRVTARQRAGGLAAVSIGPLQQIRELYDSEEFWATTLSQVLGGILAVLGVFALGLAWVRRLPYLLYFGLLTIGW